MLQSLYIKNIALIPEAEIEFDKKLNILSGETGSGKSVILDSINFVLGSKADKTMIRFGEQEASVRAVFSVDSNSPVISKLKEYDIECDGEIIITRKLSQDGRSGIKLNGVSVTAAMLKSVTQHLVDVHGQSEHFFLLNEGNQLRVLDGICGDGAREIKQNLQELIAKKKAYKAQIDELGGDESERERKLDLLGYQIDEIEKADVKPGEFEELKTRKNLIANTEKIFGALNLVHSVLNDDGGCIDGIVMAMHGINQISSLDAAYEEIYTRLDGLNSEASDIAETVADLSDRLTFDEEEAAYVDERLELLKGLKRKYGGDEEHILAFLDEARAQFDALRDASNTVVRLTKKIAACDEEIYSCCVKLTELRKKTAEKFCREVIDELKTLNISNASFSVEFGQYDRQTANLRSPDGSDEVRFMFSANKGEPQKPLSKVISGGEMSRFMLAVKTVLKDVNGISTYIFDEIDAGISGVTAVTVAKKFVKISQSTQIIAVSHLPQICAASSAHFLIYKTEEGEKAVTRLKRLEGDEKVDEIVRLTGSVKSEAAVLHAKELIQQFSN